jgi:hypothetical protein
MPFCLEAAILSRMRSPVTSRSNWAKDKSTFSVRRARCAAAPTAPSRGTADQGAHLDGWRSQASSTAVYEPHRTCSLRWRTGRKRSGLHRGRRKKAIPFLSPTKATIWLNKSTSSAGLKIKLLHRRIVTCNDELADLSVNLATSPGAETGGETNATANYTQPNDVPRRPVCCSGPGRW